MSVLLPDCSLWLDSSLWPDCSICFSSVEVDSLPPDLLFFSLVRSMSVTFDTLPMLSYCVILIVAVLNSSVVLLSTLYVFTFTMRSRVSRNHSHSLSLGLPSYCRSPLALMGSWQLGYLSVIAHRSTCHIDLCGSFSGLYQYVKELYFGALSGFSTAGQDCTGDLSSPLETLSRCWATAVVWFGWLTATWWGCSVFGQWQLHLSWGCCTFPRTRCSS